MNTTLKYSAKRGEVFYVQEDIFGSIVYSLLGRLMGKDSLLGRLMRKDSLSGRLFLSSGQVISPIGRLISSNGLNDSWLGAGITYTLTQIHQKRARARQYTPLEKRK